MPVYSYRDEVFDVEFEEDGAFRFIDSDGKTVPMRKKTETELKLHGTHRADRHGSRKTTSRGNPITSKPPTFLDRVAKAEWKRILDLTDFQVFEVDFATLAAYCSAWSQFARAEKVLQTEGEVVSVETRNGTWKTPHPMVKVRSDAAARMLKTGKMLGLNAIIKRVPEPKSPGDRFLRG